MVEQTNGGTRTWVYGALVAIVAVAVVGVVFRPDAAVNILGFCGLAVTGLFSHLQTIRQAEQQNKKLDTVAEKAETAAVKVEEVKTTLVKTDAKNEAKLVELSKTADDTHALVNSGHGVTLKLNAELSRWKADQTKKPGDEEAARIAEETLRAHIVQQEKVDAKNELLSGLERKVENIAKKVEADAKVEVTNLPPIQEVRVVK